MCIAANSVHAQESGPKVQVNAIDIPRRVEIIGALGRPLGEVVTLEGLWIAPRITGKPSGPIFVVKKVNGKPLHTVAEFASVQPATGAGLDPWQFIGETWEMTCVESGGFVGLPPALLNEIEGFSSSPIAYGFVTKLYYAKLVRRAADKN